MTLLARMNHPSARQLVHDALRKGDPTGTGDIRRRYRALVDQRWNLFKRQLRNVVVDQDMLGLSLDKQSPLSTAMAAFPHDGKIRAFQAWVDDTLTRITLEHDTTYLDPMVSIAYNRAVKRAVGLTANVVPPEAANSIAALQQLTMTELQGINEAVSQRLMRDTTDALLKTTTAKQVYVVLATDVDTIGRTRSRALVETMVAKAHSTGTLDQFEGAGVKQVGLVPESVIKIKRDALTRDAPSARFGTGPGSNLFRTEVPSESTIRRIGKAQSKLEALFPSLVNIETAGDEDVCQECQDLEDEGPYSINEARSLIPAHPWCRCTFVPADEGGD